MQQVEAAGQQAAQQVRTVKEIDASKEAEAAKYLKAEQQATTQAGSLAVTPSCSETNDGLAQPCCGWRCSRTQAATIAVSPTIIPAFDNTAIDVAGDPSNIHEVHHDVLPSTLVDLVAVESCGICFEEVTRRETMTAAARRGPNRWGRVPCCRQVFHSRCLSQWIVGEASVKAPCQDSSEYSKRLECKKQCPICRGPLTSAQSLLFE